MPRRHTGTPRREQKGGEVEASVRQWEKKWTRLSCWNLKKKKNFCEKYLQKEKPKAFPGDGIERDALEKGCSEASSSVQHTQTQTHVVPAVEDGFNQLHIMTHTHSSV